MRPARSRTKPCRAQSGTKRGPTSGSPSSRDERLARGTPTQRLSRREPRIGTIYGAGYPAAPQHPRACAFMLSFEPNASPFYACCDGAGPWPLPTGQRSNLGRSADPIARRLRQAGRAQRARDRPNPSEPRRGASGQSRRHSLRRRWPCQRRRTVSHAVIDLSVDGFIGRGAGSVREVVLAAGAATRGEPATHSTDEEIARAADALILSCPVRARAARNRRARRRSAVAFEGLGQSRRRQRV